MTSSQDRKHIQLRLESAIPQSTLFAREQPAALEGPRENWDIAITTIDFGCALLLAWNQVRSGHELSDAVISALHRRALITTEANRVLLSKGLLEPAVANARTLLEIELSLRLIIRDDSGRMAKRLAAYHYLTHQRHGQDQLADPSTRDRAKAAERVDELARIAGSYKRHLEAAVFDEVRKDLKSKRAWHGFDRMEDAFHAAGESPDYFMLYDGQTWFVHATNVDFDFADRTDAHLVLKPLVERNPAVVQVQLGHLLLRLVTMMKLIADHRGYPTTPPFDQLSIVRYPDDSTEQVTALYALMGQLPGMFPLSLNEQGHR